MSRDYEVGKGKPPKSTQFQKGRSGNPHGRPKQAANTRPQFGPSGLSSVDQQILEIAAQPMKVTTNGKVRQVSNMEALQLRRNQSAFSGNRLGAKEFTDELRAAEIASHLLQQEKYSYWRSYVRNPNHAASLGGLPSPLDIEINVITQTVRFHGPMEREELPLFELPMLLRDIMLGLAELLHRQHPLADPSIVQLIAEAWRLHARVPESLGGPNRFAGQTAALHQITACIIALRPQTASHIKKQIGLLQQQFERSAAMVGLGRPQWPVETDMHAWFNASDNGLNGRGKIICNPAVRAKVAALLAEGQTLDVIANAVAKDNISLSAISRFIRQYRTEFNQVKEAIGSSSQPQQRPRARSSHNPWAQCLQIVEDADALRTMRNTCAKEAMLRATPIVETSAPVSRGASPETIEMVKRELLGMKS